MSNYIKYRYGERKIICLLVMEKQNKNVNVGSWPVSSETDITVIFVCVIYTASPHIMMGS